MLKVVVLASEQTRRIAWQQNDCSSKLEERTARWETALALATSLRK